MLPYASKIEEANLYVVFELPKLVIFCFLSYISSHGLHFLHNVVFELFEI